MKVRLSHDAALKSKCDSPQASLNSLLVAGNSCTCPGLLAGLSIEVIRGEKM